jgi:hypothetical protein
MMYQWDALKLFFNVADWYSLHVSGGTLHPSSGEQAGVKVTTVP